jgi:hypothetical protein
MMLAGAAGMFNTGAETDASFTGNFFGKICLWLKPLNDKILEVLSLDEGNTVSIKVPFESYNLPHNWKKTEDLPVDKFILPLI